MKRFSVQNRIFRLIKKNIPENYSYDKIKPWATYIWCEVVDDDGEEYECNVFDIDKDGVYVYKTDVSFLIDPKMMKLALKIQSIYAADDKREQKKKKRRDYFENCKLRYKRLFSIGR